MLLFFSIWLFRGHFFGSSLWIGNPDRLNGDLKILSHYISSIQHFTPSAWNDNEMMGYDSFALPYTFPNPITYLVSIFNLSNLYIFSGYVNIVLLFLAGLSAYIFIKTQISSSMASLVGAVCYEFSSLTILKLSQNTMSFGVFIFIPLTLLVINIIQKKNLHFCFLALTMLIALMLNYMFLQKVAYALILAGLYSIWRSFNQKSASPFLLVLITFLIAFTFSYPRFSALVTATGEYLRTIPGYSGLSDFNSLYSFQNIYYYEILRWFDNSIFGSTPSESVSLFNNINLTEGFLLFTSSTIPFLLVFGFIRDPKQWMSVYRPFNADIAFFFWTLIFCFLVVLFKPFTFLIYELFFRMSFTHARILIVALLPLSFLISVSLCSINQKIYFDKYSHTKFLFGVILGLCICSIIEFFSIHATGVISINQFSDSVIQSPHLKKESLVRIFLSFFALLLLLCLIFKSHISFQITSYYAICSIIVCQCLISANFQVNGDQAFNYNQPFKFGDFYHARRGEFEIPTERQLQALHDRIDPINYRVALICDKNIADGFCAGHVPEFWQLRAIDGYYGPGVPRRLRSLPWPNGLSMRTVSFNNLESVPWDLLGLINVRWALVSDDGVFRNILREGDRVVGLPDPNKFELILSPARVTPRAFFAESVKPVSSPEDAVAQLFRSEGIVDPIQTSFVEGLTESKSFGVGTSITLKGAGNTLSLQFASSSEDRFLVLNDLFYPGWQAEVNGRILPILATNAVMRGVIVPPGVASLTFHYSSFLDSDAAWAFRGSAVIVMFAIFLVLRHKVKNSEPDS